MHGRLLIATYALPPIRGLFYHLLHRPIKILKTPCILFKLSASYTRLNIIRNPVQWQPPKNSFTHLDKKTDKVVISACNIPVRDPVVRRKRHALSMREDLVQLRRQTLSCWKEVDLKVKDYAWPARKDEAPSLGRAGTFRAFCRWAVQRMVCSIHYLGHIIIAVGFSAGTE
ncbi:hypothetical protein IW262DRAFT_279729 [Armillaria fumosa]|nr:hypothetical protein IW262DRAFT_279729 [Armillaria fumosa]